MSKCKTCGKDIMWIKLRSGKWNPVDKGRIPFTPDGKGELILVTEEGDVLRGNFDIRSANYGYTSHFATCPQADRHRR